MLASIILALHHNTCWYVGQANRRVSFIDVLSTGARGAVSVSTDISRIDVNLNGVINFWIDKHAGERCVATIGRVKR